MDWKIIAYAFKKDKPDVGLFIVHLFHIVPKGEIQNTSNKLKFVSLEENNFFPKLLEHSTPKYGRKLWPKVRIYNFGNVSYFRGPGALAWISKSPSYKPKNRCLLRRYRFGSGKSSLHVTVTVQITNKRTLLHNRKYR